MIKVEIQNGVQTICQSAFMNTALKSAEIPESVLTIDAYAFGYNKNFGKISDFTIFGYKNTSAESFANNNDLDFVELIKDFVPGDINNDGSVTVTDISLAAAHIKGIKNIADERTADINNDGIINVTDLSLIAAHVKGIKEIN